MFNSPRPVWCLTCHTIQRQYQCEAKSKFVPTNVLCQHGARITCLSRWVALFLSGSVSNFPPDPEKRAPRPLWSLGAYQHQQTPLIMDPQQMHTRCDREEAKKTISARHGLHGCHHALFPGRAWIILGTEHASNTPSMAGRFQGGDGSYWALNVRATRAQSLAASWAQMEHIGQ